MPRGRYGSAKLRADFFAGSSAARLTSVRDTEDSANHHGVAIKTKGKKPYLDAVKLLQRGDRVLLLRDFWTALRPAWPASREPGATIQFGLNGNKLGDVALVSRVASVICY